MRIESILTLDKPKKKSNKYFRRILESPIDLAPNEINNYMPMFSVERISVSDINIKPPKQLSAAKREEFPRWVAFFNTTQTQDYFVLEELYKWTIAGRIVDFITWLTIGKGPKPVLKLKNPDEWGTKQEQLKEIENDKNIIERLIEIDRQISDISGETGQYEHSLSEKFAGILKNALTYGKGANIKIFKDNSWHLIPLHPRDMMYNIISKEWKLEAIHTMLDSKPYALDQLIFAEYNPENPIYNNLFNGMPFILRMMDSARTLRRLKGVDFQLIAKRRWAGNSIVAIKKRSNNQEDATTLMKKLSNAEIYASEEDDPEHAYKVFDIPMKAESADLIELAKYLTNDCISLAGIPTSLFFDESAANYATMEEKMKFFKTVIDNEWRPWGGQTFAKQWYQPNFIEEFGDDEALMEKYYIDCEFVDIDFRSIESKITALTMLNKIYPIKTDSAGEFLGIENFDSMIDPNGERLQSQEISLTDSKGNKSNLQTEPTQKNPAPKKPLNSLLS